MKWRRENIAPPRALVVTALTVEYQAALRHITQPREQTLPLGMIAEVGAFGDREAIWEVALIQVGMGNERAALDTERAITAFDPETVLFIGVAGGLKDVRLGDVVVASKVYAYEYGKDADHFRPRAEALEPSYRILAQATAVTRDDRWYQRLPDAMRGADHLRPSALVKPIAAGSKVVGDTDSASAQLLRDHFSDAAAVEMEGHGFLRALHAHPERQALIVRGISDLVDGKAESDAQGWQDIASATAAAFAFQVLGRYTPAEMPVVGTQETSLQSDGDLWRELRAVLTRLYPTGPHEDRVWVRAGGDPSRLPSGTNGRTAWYDAFSLMQRGGGGVTPEALLREVMEDFPQDADLRRLMVTMTE
jgi:nucleoside phosphorylase